MRIKRYLQLCALLSVAVSGLGIAAQGESLKTHHMFSAVANGKAQVKGHLPAEQVLLLDVVLPLSDRQGLDDFVAKVTDPKSPLYEQFLTPEEFSARFGPSQQDYDATVRYLQTHGLTVVGGSLLAMDVQVKGPVSAIESAFHVTMNSYQHPTENRVFYSADREPTTDLPFALWHVSGLDNYSIPKPAMLKGENLIPVSRGSKSESKTPAWTGSGPLGYFLGSDMRAAYYGGTALTGSGQYVGLLEYAGTNLYDLNLYYWLVGQTNNVPIALVSTDGTPTSCNYTQAGGYCDDTEQTIDMTQAIGVAPGLSGLGMFVGSSDTAIIGAMAIRKPLAKTLSASWVWDPVDPSALDPYFERFAAQGQNYFAAAGDWGNWGPNNVSAWPAESPLVTAVGGTSLVTNGPGGYWESESTWGDTGSGISPDGIAIPYYQQYAGVINSSNGGSTVYRNGPDVAANADFSYVACSDQSGCYAGWGGTSFAAPLWAGYVALLNQARANIHHASIGFLNPMLYLNNSKSITKAGSFWYDQTFHDTTTGGVGPFNAVTGYDLVTGWGSPNGVKFINYYLTQ